MSGLFRRPKAPELPDPDALPEPKTRDESLLLPGSDADVDPQALLARDQATANALAQGARTSMVTLRAPYLEQRRAEIRAGEQAKADAAADVEKRREEDERRQRELDAMVGAYNA